ncbi:MAG: pilus assembly PilX N-terminal domain-containing protein [Candidatus Krumholzibacteria bacterium]|nr:pilus assembly PilX N-terminal domain-containing protein [Candidatus Krumholzibacteria bacterium]
MNSKIIENLKGESGNILVVTLLILFAISVLGATLAMVSSMDLKIAGNQRTTTQSLFVAEAGLNEAIHRISLPNPTNITVGGWTGNATIGESEPYNPNWMARIYLTRPDAAPSSGPNVYSTGTLQDPSQPYLNYSVSSGTDRVLTIQHKWRDLDGDGTRDANEIVRYDPLQIPPENLTSGFPVEVITVTGRSGNGERVIQAEIMKRMVLARTLGSLYTDKAVKLTGNCAFCGYNHSTNTPPGTRPNACNAWHLSSGHLPGVSTTGDDVKVVGSAEVAGNPIPIDKSSTNPFYSLAEVLGLTDAETNQLLANADNTSITIPLNGITYINGEAKINSNITGEGLLYVTGDLTGNGNFQYKGLIYVEGDLKMIGTPWILGSVVVKGTSDWNFSAGNAAVLYSKDAITNALSSAMPCIVLSWREM